MPRASTAVLLRFANSSFTAYDDGDIFFTAPPNSFPQTSLLFQSSSETYSKTGVHRLSVGGPDECIDSIAASAYLNQPAVMAALHVKPAPSGTILAFISL